jgi:hypothetical protein
MASYVGLEISFDNTYDWEKMRQNGLISIKQNIANKVLV